MNKLNKIGCLTIIIALTINAGCGASVDGRREIKSGDRKITVLNAKVTTNAEKEIVVNDFDIEKIDRYEGVRGEDWVNEGEILITKENTKLKPIRISDQLSNVRNLYLLKLISKEQKSVLNNQEFIGNTIVSPDKKHIFLEKFGIDGNSSVVIDLNGNTKAIVKEDTKKGFRISYNNARWVDNSQVVVPSSEDGICLININRSSEIIKNIGRMQTDYVEKIGMKVYYVSVDRKLIEYNLKTKKSIVIKEKVLNFVLSPKKNMFAIEKKLGDNRSELVLTDLNGHEKSTIMTAKMIFGISWSPDQTKVAYIITTGDESKNGLYIAEVNSERKLYVSADYVDIQNGLKWSPSSNKILACIGEIKGMKVIDNTYIINLR